MPKFRAALSGPETRTAGAELLRWKSAEGPSSFFLAEPWMSTWLDLMADDARSVRVTGGDDEPVAEGFFCRSRERRLGGLVRARRLNLNTTGDPERDTIFLEHNGLRGPAGADPRALVAVIDALEDDPSWDECLLHALTDPLADAVCARWPRHRIIWEAPSYALDLDGVRRTGGDYLATLSKNTRQQLRRSLRLYEERGELRLEAARDAEQALEFLGDLEQLHEKAWRDRGLESGAFGSPWFRRFHEAMIRDHHAGGGIELLRVTAGDGVIGLLYNFVHDGHVHAYQSGFTTEEDNRLKPGLVCHYLAILRHLESGARLYDLLAGDQRYKASLAEPGPRMRSVLLWRPRAGLLLEDLARRVRALSVQVEPPERSESAARKS